jgi:hypothetical protein
LIPLSPLKPQERNHVNFRQVKIFLVSLIVLSAID